MKKLIIIMLCILAAFAVASCKQDPKGGSTTEENGGTLTVKPGSVDPNDETTALTWSQEKKFQFLINQVVIAEESVEFLAKVSADVTEIDVRDGATNNTWNTSNAKLTDLSTTDDGWYIIQIDGAKTSSCEKIGITLRVPTQNADIFISIKNLKIDGELIDFSEWNEATCVEPYYSVPNRVEATITK